MAISLKEQLTQARQLTELIYHAPKFDKAYYNKAYHNNHKEGRASGRRLFYDFYAMEFLWSFLGSGQIPKAERERMAHLDPDDPRRDYVSKAHRFLPARAANTIDDVYQQVTLALADGLIGYVNAAVVQEFQYLTQYSHGWTSFRQAIVSHYNKNGTVSKEDFDRLVRQNIPEMASHPKVVKKLLKFSKYFSEMHTKNDQDPSDVTRQVSGPSTKAPIEEPPVDTAEPEVEPVEPSEPDNTDYDAKVRGRRFGKYGGPGQPEAPYPQDWSGHSAFKDVGDLPKIPDDEDDDEGEAPAPLTEELINMDKVKDVYKAMIKAGLTLEDLSLGYNKVPWGGSFGGKRWGAGVDALIKLIKARKERDFDAMNAIIDHIYDLQHNTGSLLNKGPMYISDDDLNRRYKVTDVTRFIPFVSPMIKNLILRFQPYLRVDPKIAEKEANMETLLKSPKVEFTQEEKEALAKLGLSPSGPSFQVGINFYNKAGDNIGGSYTISKHKVGHIGDKGFVPAEGEPVQYVVHDNYMADVKAFDTFEDANKYLENHKKDFNKGYATQATYTPNPQDQYLQSHTKIRLDVNKEQILLNNNMGWRAKAGSQYYKAYMADGDRFRLFAFSDGTFLGGFQNKHHEYQIFTDWPSALKYVEKHTKNAMEYPKKAEAQAEIDAKKSGKIISTPSASAPAQTGTYELNTVQVQVLQNLVQTKLPHKPDNNFVVQPKANGMYAVVQKKYHTGKEKFAIGHNKVATFGKTYKVVKASGGEKLFANWIETIAYVEGHIYDLTDTPAPATSPSAVTPTAYPTGELPPNATSTAAYNVHSGIAKTPSTSIRLTAEDEQKLTDIGFSPKMIGSNVWYVHAGTGDTVKFYPNNMAKVIFVSMPNAGITNTIDKVLKWLPTKYSKQVTSSPIKTGASVVQPGMPSTPQVSPTAPTKGIQAGVMFAKDIQEAGFTWDAMGSEYVDYLNGPGSASNVLKIAPDRSSVLTFADGIKVPFQNLAQLVTYLKSKYPEAKEDVKKKSNADVTAPEKEKWSVPPTILELLKKGKFEFVGTTPKSLIAHDNGYVFDNPEHDRVIFFEDGKSLVFINNSKAKKEDFHFDYPEQLLGWLETNFGTKHPKYVSTPLAKVPGWIDDKLMKLLEKGKFKFDGEAYGTTGKHPTYKNPSGDELVLFSNDEYAEVRDSLNPNKVETFNKEQFTEWLQEKFGSVVISQKPPKVQAQEITRLLKKIHYIEGSTINAHRKIEAIKVLRQYVLDETGLSAGLANTKWAVEHLGDFLDYVQNNGLPEMYAGIDNVEKKVNDWKDQQLAIATWKDIQGKKHPGVSTQEPPPSVEPQLPEPAAGEPNALSDDEMNAISKIIKQHPGFTAKKDSYLEEAKKKSGGKHFLTIFDKEKNPVFAIQKENGKFKLWSTPEEHQDLIGSYATFNELVPALKTTLQNYVPNEPKLTNDQVEWIEAYVKNHVPDVSVELSKNGHYVEVRAASKDILFQVIKTPGSSYKVQHFFYDTEHGEVKYSYQSFGTFSDLASSIETNIDSYTQLNSHLKNLLSMSQEELVDKLTNIGFKSLGSGEVHGHDIDIFQHTNGVQVNIGEKGYSEYNTPEGNSYKFHTYKGLSDYLDQFDYAKHPSKITSSGEHFRLKGKGQFLPNEHLQDLAAEYGFTPMDHDKVPGSILYSNQAGDFYFEVFENGVRWTTEKGAKEKKMMPHEQFDFFHNVFEGMDEDMTAEDLDYLFTKNTFTPEEKAFDRILRKAKLNEGIQLKGTPTEQMIFNNEFEWNDFDKVYMNEEIKQVVSVNPSAISSDNYIFRIYWVGEGNKTFQSQTGNSSKMLASIGPSGAIQMNVPARIKVPDAETEYPFAGSPTVDPKNPYPFSGENYNENPDDDHLEHTKLNEHDSNILNKIGFTWNEKKKWYVKKVSEKETPALEEAGKKKGTKKKKSPKHVAQQFDFNFEQKYEIIIPWNSGNALWTESDDPNNADVGKDADDKIKEGPILYILKFVWHRWGSGDLLNDPEGKEPTDAVSEELYKLGFKWVNNPNIDWKEYRKHEYADEKTIMHKVQVYPSGMLNYTRWEQPKSTMLWTTTFNGDYQIPSGLEMLKNTFYIQHLQTPGAANYNTVAQDGVLKPVHLEKADADYVAKFGYELDPNFQYPTYTKGEQSFTVYNDGTSHYKNNSSQHNFKDVKEGLKFLKDIDATKGPTTGEPTYTPLAEPSLRDKLLELMFTKITTPLAPAPEGKQVKEEWFKGQTTEILQVLTDGTTRYGAYSSSTIIWYDTFKTLNDAVNYLYKSFKNEKNVSAHRVKPSTEVEENMEQLGFYWDDPTVQFVKHMTNGLTTVIFMSDGKIFFHNSLHQDTDAELTSPEQLYVYLKTVKAAGKL